MWEHRYLAWPVWYRVGYYHSWVLMSWSVNIADFQFKVQRKVSAVLFPPF